MARWVRGNFWPLVFTILLGAIMTQQEVIRGRLTVIEVKLGKVIQKLQGIANE